MPETRGASKRQSYPASKQSVPRGTGRLGGKQANCGDVPGERGCGQLWCVILPACG